VKRIIEDDRKLHGICVVPWQSSRIPEEVVRKLPNGVLSKMKFGKGRRVAKNFYIREHGECQ